MSSLNHLEAAVRRLANAESLLERAHMMVESKVSVDIECAVIWRKDGRGKLVPQITEEVKSEFWPGIELVRALRAYFGTGSSPDPDWFDELIEGEHLDGRAFASKSIDRGVDTRFRFKSAEGTS